MSRAGDATALNFLTADQQEPRPPPVNVVAFPDNSSGVGSIQPPANPIVMALVVESDYVS